jgi:hypothetical protein
MEIEIKINRQRFKLLLNRGDILKYIQDDNGTIIRAYGYFNRFIDKPFWLNIAD